MNAKREMWKVSSLVALVALSLVLTGPCPSTNAQQAKTGPLKVAILLSGPISDQGWNRTGYDGLMGVKEPGKVEVSFMESVQLQDFETAFRDYASKGYNMVIGHGFQFADSAIKVAKLYPKTYFVINTGTFAEPPNLLSVKRSEWQGAYLIGVLAGNITKSKKVGFIGGTEMPPIKGSELGFGAGVKAVDPSIKYIPVYINSLEDVNKGKETALSLIDSGVDCLLTNANVVNIGGIQAAAQRGIYAFGYNMDQTNVAPNAVVASGITRSQLLIQTIVKKLREGTIEIKGYEFGLREGAEDIAWNPKFRDLWPNVVKKVEKAKDDLLNDRVPSPIKKK